MKIEIRNSAGTPCYQDVVRKSSKRKFTLMKEDFILLKFSLKSPVFLLYWNRFQALPSRLE